MRHFAPVALLLGFVTACSAGPGTPVSLSGTRWSLVESTLAKPAPAGAKIGLEFSSDRLSARSGCNSGGGSYQIADRRLVVGQMMSTKMACLGPAGEYEPVFFAFLAAQPTLRLEGDELILESAAGRLRLRAESPAP